MNSIPMRRHRQQLSQQQSINLLESSTSGTLSLNQPDGFPYQVPLSYVYTDGKLYFHCAQSGYKLDLLHHAYAATAIADASHMACVANDFGYEYVFSRYIEGVARSGDVLLGISPSGTSKNVLRAVEASRVKGVKVVSLTGRADSPIAKLSDVAIVTPGGRYADRVQELHIKCIHIFIELVERRLNPENYAGE